MKYTNVRYFLAVCEHRNFTHAARFCGVSQPTLTNSIRRLEKLMGASLFQRTKGYNGQISPTELAAAITPHLQQALSAMDRAMSLAKRRVVPMEHHSGVMDLRV